MENDRFCTLAQEVLAYISEQIEKQDENYLIEVDVLGDILSIKIDAGEYVINKHSAAKEIWLASPLSGPYHFFYRDGKWVNKKGIELLSLLSVELSFVTKIEL